jgi:hypothetical protein
MMAQESAAKEVTSQEKAAQEAPAAQEPVIKKPAAKKPPARKTAAKTSAAKKGVAKKPAAKGIAVKKRVAKKTVPKKPTSKRPTAMKTSARKPAAKKSASKKRKPKKQTPSNGTTKAQAIRDAFKELGKKARPRHIIAALASKGITVAPAQVSTVLKAAGLRRGRRRKRAATAVGPKTSANGHALNINELVKVKKLAEELGGTTKLKELAAALERLM